MTEYASFDELIEQDPDDNAEDVRLPSGKIVRVRGLTRHELMFNNKGLSEGDGAVLERRNIKSCLLNPVLTVEQIETWQRRSSAGGDIRVLSEKIRDLSGLGKGADKSDPGASGE